MNETPSSEFRVEKHQAVAIVTLLSGATVHGCFFVASGSSRHAGAERVGDLLNAEPGFFPFEVQSGEMPGTVLYNRNQVVTVALADDEARRDPGYAVATRRFASILLSNGRRIVGTVHVYRPAGCDRLSDWARHSDAFRYIETDETTMLVNMAHVVEVHEVAQP